MTAIQFIEPTNTNAEAETIFAFLGGQVGYLGGRILQPSQYGWRVQTFFTAADVPAGTLLPDGCRTVWIPESQFKVLGILEATDAT